jgi:hypothetical protein
MTLAKAKLWLKEDDDTDDELIEEILESIDTYFSNSIDTYDDTNEKMMKILKIPTVAMLCDMHENRSLTVNTGNDKIRLLVQSAVLQAQYCYPVEEEETTTEEVVE